MNRQQIHNTIASLAMSQGLYGRLMAGFYGDYDEILDWLADEVKPSCPLDVVLAIEE